MIELTSKQRKYLEKLAHDIEPVVIVGAAGVTEGVTKMVAEMLGAHELIKVKFNEYKDDKRELTEQLCAETGATLVRVIGNRAILYLPHEKEEDRKIKL